jgi:hypothetical protein
LRARALTESYSNLLAFASSHGLAGWRAAIAPGAVDSFVVLGELLLFAAYLLGWRHGAPYAFGYALAAWGFLLSVGGNAWHAPASRIDMAVAAIWPVTAAAALAGALVITRQLMETSPPASSREPRASSPAARAARARGPAADRKHGRVVDPARQEREQAVIAELVSSGTLPPLEFLRAELGSVRSARRVRDAARAAMNGSGHG